MKQLQVVLVVIALLASYLPGMPPNPGLAHASAAGVLVSPPKQAEASQRIIEPAYLAVLRAALQSLPPTLAQPSRPDLSLPLLELNALDRRPAAPPPRMGDLSVLAPFLGDDGPRPASPSQQASPLPRPLAVEDPNVALSLTGPANANNYEPITYVISLRNTTALTQSFNVTHTVPNRFLFITSTVVSETGVFGDPWIVTLAPSDTRDITVTYETKCDASSGQFSVYASSTGYDAKVARVYTTVQNGDITLDKTPTTSLATVGTVVAWRVTVHSTGFGPVRFVTVTDVLSDGLDFVGVDFNGSGAAVSSTTATGAYAYYDYIPVGESRTFTVSAQVNNACYHLVNEVFANWGPSGDGCNPQYAKASIALAESTPNVTFSIAPSPIQALFCAATLVTLTVRNAPGAGTAYSTTVLTTLPTGYGIANLQVGGVPTTGTLVAGTTYMIPAGVLAGGGLVTVTFSLTPTSGFCALGAGVMTFDVDEYNQCRLLVTAPPPQLVNVTAPARPTLSVSKSAPGVVNAGETIPYSLTVAYNGQLSLAGDVIITETLPTNFPNTSVPISITPGGYRWDPVGRTITWTVPATSVTPGVFFSGGFVLTIPVAANACAYCNRVFNNNVEARMTDRCAGCVIAASASAATAVNCLDATRVVTGTRSVSPGTQEACRLFSYINTYTRDAYS